MTPTERAAVVAETEAAIVAWLRGQAATWERLSRKSAARGKEYAHITDSQASIAASYSDHADAIERGEYRGAK
jgi:hypothetical protein